ncbi:MAG: Lrp/AsnC family transcriptional regulator [Actinomycetota bacterium]|nr:Lrp/AsnC family transcriptional regulator [Actinomycetota bacterium]
MDDVDRQIVEALRTNARSTYAELGRLVGLSPPAAHERVAKLESSGIITGYHASVEPIALGLGVSALVGLLLSDDHEAEDVVTALHDLPEIEDCWMVAGEETLVIKVRVPDVDSLEKTLGALRRIRGISRTRTTVVLSTRWENQVRPT